jgi:hypothetical protein
MLMHVTDVTHKEMGLRREKLNLTGTRLECHSVATITKKF